MRLDFTILWIDDQPKHVKSFSEGLGNHLRQLGFQLNVIPAESVEMVDAQIGNHVYDDTIDLVLVDYDLGTGAGGEEALVTIRKRFPFKEVVFYSATDAEKLRSIAFKSKVDGVYFSTRLSLVSDTIQIVRKLLNKVLDLDHMRGIVMSASSDIDYLVESSLEAVYERLGDADKPSFQSSIIEQLRIKLSKWEGELEAAAGKGSLAKIMKLRHLFTAHDRLECLASQLVGWAAEHSSYLEKVDVYKKDLIPRRNKLAHAMLRRKDGEPPELIGLPEKWTTEDMTALRCGLIEHRENFQAIAVLVDARLD
ncbi:hypothetical protein RE432_00855 [Pusillimonas sp. SM2304]|uniref:hypothetical protein n=1 Tax=Pusillimonas sp. SM2304 TaxID=3073241 RepID=UPI002874826B|nr:hypothetical protein [Pusillimonas sp. SM2304]MDS1138964.1 hypothetical protein [Pusillimonas sp. SM2304]